MAKKARAIRPKQQFIPCQLMQLEESLLMPAAEDAIDINPANRPRIEDLTIAQPDIVLTPQHLAVLTTKYWGQSGVKLGVAFVDNPPADLRAKLLSHFNAWATAQGVASNVVFAEASANMAEVRVSRGNGGYWSFLGTDVRRVSGVTMNLQGFTMQTSDAEFRRVVRHEVGHTLGFPHEHLRRAIIQRLDVQKTLNYFRRTQGWSEATTRSNVLTPLEEASIMGTPTADETSIMAYRLPAEITKDGRPIVGGGDINPTDAQFCAKIYPGISTPTPPPPTDGVTTVPEAGLYKIVEVPGGKKALIFNP